MTGNLYQPPQADISEQSTELDSGKTEFYIVAPKKFIILFIATLGMYQLYWMYINWDLYRKKNNEKLWPVPRAIFSIFYTHSRLTKVESRNISQEKKSLWNPGLLATIIVGASIISTICER